MSVHNNQSETSSLGQNTFQAQVDSLNVRMMQQPDQVTPTFINKETNYDTGSKHDLNATHHQLKDLHNKLDQVLNMKISTQHIQSQRYTPLRLETIISRPISQPNIENIVQDKHIIQINTSNQTYKPLYGSSFHQNNIVLDNAAVQHLSNDVISNKIIQEKVDILDPHSFNINFRKNYPNHSNNLKEEDLLRSISTYQVKTLDSLKYVQNQYQTPLNHPMEEIRTKRYFSPDYSSVQIPLVPKDEFSYRYDKDKLDQIVSKIRGPNATNTTRVDHNGLNQRELDQTNHKNNTPLVRYYNTNVPKESYKASYNKGFSERKRPIRHEAKKKSYCGNMEADEDSMILDDEEERVPKRISKKQAKRSKEFDEETSRQNKKSKRQEIISAKKNQNRTEKEIQDFENQVEQEKFNPAQFMSTPSKPYSRHVRNFDREQSRATTKMI